MPDTPPSPYIEAEEALLRAYDVDDARRLHVDVPALACVVRVVDIGPADGTPILFLHGSPNAGPTWMPLVAALRRRGRYRCLLLDGPGFGLSSASAQAPRRHAEALPAVLDALDLSAVHLVASSYGSGVAARFFADHPSRVRSVVHHGCPGILPASPQPGLGLLSRFAFALIAMVVLGKTPRGSLPMWRAIGHGPSLRKGTFPTPILDWYAALLAHTDTLAANDALMKATMQGWRFDLRHFADEEDLQKSPPTLLFWGEHDTTGGALAARALQASIPGASVVLMPDAGHLPWLDEPEAAAAHTGSFIDAHEPAACGTAREVG